ncbi:MAG: glycoside hydrolase family 2 TIM barrel-domain containing protein [Saccharofermentanales bacterium]
MSIRETINFNTGFKFKKGIGKTLEKIDFSSNDWESVDLPHDWAISQDVRRDASPAQGFFDCYDTGWYVKNFEYDETWDNKLIFIQFDGSYMNTTVWVNRKEAGFRPYGYIGFVFEITGELQRGENEVVIRVDNSTAPTDRWYSGSGIYRDLWLIAVDEIHISHWGTYVTTPIAEREIASVDIQTEIENKFKPNKKIVVKNTVFTARKKIAGSECSEMELADFTSFNKQTIIIKNPELWSIEHPHLYTVLTEIIKEDKIIDDYTTTFGIRDIEFNNRKGLLLNGKAIKLKGVNLHHDSGCTGACFYKNVWIKKLEALKEIGCNAIRASHNPQSPIFYDLCDKMGFLVFDEAFDKWHWQGGYYKDLFSEWWRQDLESMLKINRNHPCIFIWSVGNEVENQSEPEMLKDLKELVDFVKAYEPTRPVTLALEPHCNPFELISAPISHKVERTKKIAEIVDVLSCNYQEQWYEEYRKAMPDKLIIGSECYAYFRGRDNLFAAFSEQNPWFDVVKHPYVLGQFLWAGIAYLGESTGWPAKGGVKGIIDTTSTLSPRAYFHKSMWTKEKMVHIAVNDEKQRFEYEFPHWSWPKLVSHWNIDYMDGELIRILVFSNCETVELILNGNSFGEQIVSEAKNKTTEWYIPYKQGELIAVGRDKGIESTRHSIKTAKRSTKISCKLEFDIEKIQTGEVFTVDVYLLDEDGILVPDSDTEIEISTNGSVRLLGIDNSDLQAHYNYSSCKAETFRGHLLGVFKAINVGDAIIGFEAKGLEKALVHVAIKK